MVTSVAAFSSRNLRVSGGRHGVLPGRPARSRAARRLIAAPVTVYLAERLAQRTAPDGGDGAPGAQAKGCAMWDLKEYRIAGSAGEAVAMMRRGPGKGIYIAGGTDLFLFPPAVRLRGRHQPRRARRASSARPTATCSSARRPRCTRWPPVPLVTALRRRAAGRGGRRTAATGRCARPPPSAATSATPCRRPTWRRSCWRWTRSATSPTRTARRACRWRTSSSGPGGPCSDGRLLVGDRPAGRGRRRGARPPGA